MSEEWFDVKATPAHSEDISSKQPKSSAPSAAGSIQERSITLSQPGEPSEANAVKSEKPIKQNKQKGKQRQFALTPSKLPSADKAQEVMPVLMRLFQLGEELVPLLVTLARMGEEWSRTQAFSKDEQEQRPWPASASEKTRDRHRSSETASAGQQDDAELTPTASHTAAGDACPKTPISTETKGNSALTPSTSKSNGTNVQSSPLESQSKEIDTDFDSFKRLCSTHGFLRHPLGLGVHDVCDGINDEATLRRFFDARKRDVTGAHKQFEEAWQARKANNICAFYDRIGIEEFQETRDLNPAWSGRRDKSGRPICLFDFGKLDSKTMAAYRKTSAEMNNLKSELEIPDTMSMERLRAFAVYEHLTRFIMPLCTAVPGRPNQESPVTKMLCIVDISGIGLKQVWSLRHYLQDLAKLFATSYPEILSRVLIIGAPSYFPTIWGWIKKWVDPNTMEKLCILTQEEVLPTLQQYVEMANIPKRFGGDFDFSHGMEPKLDPVIADMLSWEPPNSQIPKGPMKWIDENWGKRTAVAVGSSQGRIREEKIAVLRPKSLTRNFKRKKTVQDYIDHLIW